MEITNISRIKDLQMRLDKLLKQAVEDKFIPGASLLIMQDGREVAFCSAGYADIDNKIPMQRGTIYRLYSLSKPITAVAVMILMERGVIDLFDPISKYLHGFKNQTVALGRDKIPVKREVTIKDLLSMTSGMPYGDCPNKAGEEVAAVFGEIDQRLYENNPMTTLEIANQLGKCSLSFQPGEMWQYGTSADILGAIIEVVTGLKYGAFLNKMLFEPLGMKDTGFFVPADKQSRLAKVYEECDTGLREIKTNYLGIRYSLDSAPAFESGGAGLVSTIEDYAKFAAMLLNHGSFQKERILSPKTVEFLTTAELLPWQQTSMWKEWEHLAGYTYGSLMRICKHSGMCLTSSKEGEYGWSGWVGTYFVNIPTAKLTVLFAMQKKNAGTTPLTRKLLNVIYSELLSDW